VEGITVPRDIHAGETDRSREAPGRPLALESIVVRYDDRPDRCTIAPKTRTDENALTAWLTADRSAFVDLGNVR